MDDYPCPGCGYEGPHTPTDDDDDVDSYECGSCLDVFDAAD
jgi:hypothetical protein